jgi:hypothetical protein
MFIRSTIPGTEPAPDCTYWIELAEKLEGGMSSMPNLDQG